MGIGSEERGRQESKHSREALTLGGSEHSFLSFPRHHELS